MNIKELKEYIKDLPDYTEVVIADSEGGYNKFDKVLTKQLEKYLGNRCIEFQEGNGTYFITLE